MAGVNTMVVYEPLFRGTRVGSKQVVKDSISAEDFIERLDTLQVTNDWTNERAAAFARSYLRDQAAEWFHYDLPALRPEEHTAMLTSWVAFRARFIKDYFKVKATVDLSTDWSNLRQGPDEPAYMFASRLFGVLYKYKKLLQPALPTAAQEATLTPLLQDILHADDAEGRAEARRAFNVALRALFVDRGLANTDRVLNDMGIKLLAAGIRVPKLMDLVRIEERKGKTPTEIRDKLEDVESSTAKRDNGSMSKKSTIPDAAKLAAVADLLEEDDESGYLSEGTIEAIRIHKAKKHSKANLKPASQGNGKHSNASGGTANGSGQKAGTTRSSTGKTPGIGSRADGTPYYCTFCGGAVGHVLKKCPHMLKHKPKTTGAPPTSPATKLATTAAAQLFPYSGGASAISSITDAQDTLSNCPSQDVAMAPVSTSGNAAADC